MHADRRQQGERDGAAVGTKKVVREKGEAEAQTGGAAAAPPLKAWLQLNGPEMRLFKGLLKPLGSTGVC